MSLFPVNLSSLDPGTSGHRSNVGRWYYSTRKEELGDVKTFNSDFGVAA